MFVSNQLLGGAKWQCLSAFSATTNTDGGATEKTVLEAYDELLLELGLDIDSKSWAQMIKGQDPFQLPKELDSTHSSLQTALSNFDSLLQQNFSAQYQALRKNLIELLQEKAGKIDRQRSKSKAEDIQVKQKAHAKIPWPSSSKVYNSDIDFLPIPLAFVGAQWFSPLFISIDGEKVSPLPVVFSDSQIAEWKIEKPDIPIQFTISPTGKEIYLTYGGSPHIFVAPTLDEHGKPNTSLYPVALKVKGVTLRDERIVDKDVGITFTPDRKSLVYYTAKAASLVPLDATAKARKLKLPSSLAVNFISYNTAKDSFLVLGEEKILRYDKNGNKLGEQTHLWMGDKDSHYNIEDNYFYSRSARSHSTISLDGTRLFFSSTTESNDPPTVHSVDLLTGEVRELILPKDHVTPNEFDNGPKIRDMALTADGKILILNTEVVRNPGVPVIPKLVAIELSTGKADSFSFPNETVINGFSFNQLDDFGYVSMAHAKQIQRIPLSTISGKLAK